MFSVSRTPANAVVIGEKLSVIEFHAARGSGVGIGISVAAFPFFFSSVGRSAQQGGRTCRFRTRAKTNKLQTPKIILITHQKQLLVWLRVFVHTCREIPV